MLNASVINESPINTDSAKSMAKMIPAGVPRHPLSIRPAGNVYTAIKNVNFAAGYFSNLPDEVLVHTLEYLDATSLRRIATCKKLYAFSRLDDLWKRLVINSSNTIQAWHGTWYSTYLDMPASQRLDIDCSGLYSDVLHRPHFCAHLSLEPYYSEIPPRNDIPRLPNMTAIEFNQQWTNKPFILTEPVKEWPLFLEWSTQAMLEEYGQIKFRAEAVDWPLRVYVEYMNNNHDECPLYLFDRSFVEKMALQVGKEGQYWAPDCFGFDLFAVLGDQRPDSRWLIVGPERSGSTFHKDPNATSAWNAVLRGSKYWIMFPSFATSPPPPGVFVSEDQSEVTSPLSIAEWFLGFHAEARKTPNCKEGICYEGEVLHVPSGWWHLVVNLSPSIAITQNFVPEVHLANVLDFLKHKPEQVSGFSKTIKDPYGLFVQKIQKHYPNLLLGGVDCAERRRMGKKRKWKELVSDCKSTGDGAWSFNFGFGDGDGE